MHELVILVTGARFSARYELYAHEFTAEKAGLSPAKIAALAAGARPGDLTADEATAFDVATALTRGAQLPESTYQASIEAFGETGTGELIFLIGFYCLISVLLNGFDVPIPKRDSDYRITLQGGILMSNFDLNRREIVAGLLSVGGAMMIDSSPASAENLPVASTEMPPPSRGQILAIFSPHCRRHSRCQWERAYAQQAGCEHDFTRLFT